MAEVFCTELELIRDRGEVIAVIKVVNGSAIGVIVDVTNFKNTGHEELM